MDASSPAGDGEKFDIIINMMSKLNDKLELIDCRVKELEVDDNSTIGIKSESSEKEKNDTKLMELGFLLPDYTGVYKYDKGVEKLSDNVISNMSKLWSNINKNYYKIKKYLLELFSLHGCDYIGDNQPTPISIDAIVKEYNDTADKNDKKEIIDAFDKDIHGGVMWKGAKVLSRIDYQEFNQQRKTIKGVLNNVSIEHEKIGRIMQDGGSALDECDLIRVYQALNNHYATRTATTRITLMIKLLTIVLEAVSVGEKIDLIRTIDKVQEAKKELEDQGAKFDELLYISILCLCATRKEDYWGKQIEERIEEAENEGTIYSLDECTHMLTKKASKQKSQDDMMTAIDKLSNVGRKKVDKIERKVEVTVNLAVKKFLQEHKGTNYCHKCVSLAKSGDIKCEDIQIFPHCKVHKIDRTETKEDSFDDMLKEC